MAIIFNGSEKPTLGVEIELQLIDPETKNLAQCAPAVLKYFKDSPSIKPEIICSNIEVITGVCQDIKEVESDLTNSLEKLQKVCKKEGCEVASAGTHPFAQWGEQGITDSERYHALLDRLQFPVRMLIIFGLHIHVGIPSGEKVIAISNAMTTFIPHFLALSASSPYWNNQDTGLASSR